MHYHPSNMYNLPTLIVKNRISVHSAYSASCLLCAMHYILSYSLHIISAYSLRTLPSYSLQSACRHIRLGQYSMYQQFEIEKYRVCGKLILPNKLKDIFSKFFLAQLVCEFSWIFEYLQASCIQLFKRYAVKNLIDSSFT